MIERCWDGEDSSYYVYTLDPGTYRLTITCSTYSESITAQR